MGGSERKRARASLNANKLTKTHSQTYDPSPLEGSWFASFFLDGRKSGINVFPPDRGLPTRVNEPPADG